MLKDFTKEEFDIIIQAGQSNSEGTAYGHATNPYIPNEKVYYLNNDFTISMAQEKVDFNNIVGNFSLSFSTEYINNNMLKNNRKLLIIRSAIGGTGFLDNRWKLEDDLFLKMMDMTKTALSLNPKNKLIAFLWHQGETDANLNASKDQHYNNLKTLITTVRNTFDVTNLPFIAGDFVQQWKAENKEISETIITAIKEVCNDIGNAHFVETDGLQSNDEKLADGDTIHFCREGINELGVRYFRGFCG